MSPRDTASSRRFAAMFSGPNLAYVEEQYERYLEDPNLVEPTLREWFEYFGAPERAVNTYDVDRHSETNSLKIAAAVRLANNIRTYGHLAADTNPIMKREQKVPQMEPGSYGLTREDLQNIPAEALEEFPISGIQNGWEAIQRLKQLYTQKIAFEFMHVQDREEREWLLRAVESERYQIKLSKERKLALLDLLLHVEEFEDFLHHTFVGQKRFSIEGLDMLVPMLDSVVREGVQDGSDNILIGMAHRGRLNVLAHVLGKPYEAIFAEFYHSPEKFVSPSASLSHGWSGDVKYHLGGRRPFKEEGLKEASITLANNPSHLEFVNPVVKGFTRASQEDRAKPGYPVQDVTKAMAVLVHGDSAFPGEGIVAETLNLSGLRGYHTGGSIHIIANNQIGFTTNSIDSRSTKYASDLAKGYEIPIVHVNADDPESCLLAVFIATEYRKLFKKDFIIDLIGYRKYGHNEGDDPVATQPKMYELIPNHPSAGHQYGLELAREGIIQEADMQTRRDQIRQELQAAYERMKNNELPPSLATHIQEEGIPVSSEQRKTGVPLEMLNEINQELLNFPEGFNIYPKLKRIFDRRKDVFTNNGKVEWAHAEMLAFATLLSDGTPIRITGQDSERGTFAHRHMVLHDTQTGDKYSPLHDLPTAKASFAIHNSPLSEASVLGYEYGYDVFSRETLVIWEAQFGDFANAAQVIIDQFIAAGRAKWNEVSSLVMLLPHGYEGQGPEHSSARLERFLQSSANDNWTVANLTTSAQYFHLLRRQAAMMKSDDARPLVVMSPKSLLRHPSVMSSADEFVNGEFKPVIASDDFANPEQIRRLILCSGKVLYDLQEKRKKSSTEEHDGIGVISVEQLYPFPEQEIQQYVEQLTNLEEIVWLQEEPQNMGAWFFMEPRLRSIVKDRLPIQYVGRSEQASPSTGYAEIHKQEQQQIVEEALDQTDNTISIGGRRND